MQEHTHCTPTHATHATHAHAGSLDSAVNDDQYVPTSNMLAVNCAEFEKRFQELCYMVLAEPLNRPVR